jgi:hypothetical protein
MMLLAIALFGLLVPNGLFVYWLVHEYGGLAAALQNKPAVALMIDAFMAVGLLAFYFAREPIGRVKWPWFVALSLVGGLGFSLPLYFWLNRRVRVTPQTSRR